MKHSADDNCTITNKFVKKIAFKRVNAHVNLTSNMFFIWNMRKRRIFVTQFQRWKLIKPGPVI